MITLFKIYEKLILDDVEVKVENINDNQLKEIIEELSIVIQKRIKRNLRVMKISGYMDKLQIQGRQRWHETSLKITMSNKDILDVYYKYISDTEPTGILEIIINDKLVYDISKKDLSEEKWITKMCEEYKKYLKNDNWKI